MHLKENNELPIFHIVPSRYVARRMKSGHKKWLETPGRNGQMHNDSNMRVWGDEKNKYLDKWDLLELDK